MASLSEMLSKMGSHQLGTENQYFLADLTHNLMLLWINLVIIVVKESGY